MTESNNGWHTVDCMREQFNKQRRRCFRVRLAGVVCVLALLLLASPPAKIRAVEGSAPGDGVLTVAVTPAADSTLIINGTIEPLTSGIFSLTDAPYGTYNIYVQNPYMQFFYKTVELNSTSLTVHANLKPPSLLGSTNGPWVPLGPAFFPNLQGTTVDVKGVGSGGVIQYASGHSGEIALLNSDPNVIYQATGSCSGYANSCPQSYGGVYKTVNGGASWVPVDLGLPLGIVSSIYLDQSSPNILLVGFEYPSGGIYRTDDGGGYWYNVGQFGQTRDITETANKSLLAATSDGVVESGDMGMTWKTIFSQPDIGALSVSGDTIYAYSAKNGYLYKSLDLGRTWTKMEYFPPSSFGTISASPWNSSTVYISDSIEFVSHDGGAQFEPVASLSGQGLLGIMRAVVLDPSNQSRAWAFGEGYLGYSTDGGTQFTQTAQGTDNMALVVDPLNDSVLVLGSDEGVYESLDSGKTWNSVNGNLSDNLVTSLSLSLDGSFIALGLQDYNSMLSLDGGAVWTGSIDSPLSGEDTPVYVNPYNSSWAYALTPNIGFGGAPTTLMVSDDMGHSFHAVSLVNDVGPYPTVYQMYANPYNTSEVFVGTQGGVYIGSYYGSSWSYWNGSPSEVTSIAMDGPQSYFVGTSHGLYRFQGGVWSQVSAIPCITYSVSVDPGNTSISVVSTEGCSNGHVFVSKDHGATYTPTNLISGGEPPWFVQFLNSTGYPLLGFGDSTMGLYLTSDLGQTWVPITYNLEAGDVTGVQLVAGSLYIATYGEGILKLSDFSVSSLPATVNVQVYPAASSVTMDGSPLETYDGHSQLFLRPGTYNFNVTYRGQSQAYVASLSPAETTDISIHLNVTLATTTSANSSVTAANTTSTAASAANTGGTSTHLSSTATASSAGVPEFPYQGVLVAVVAFVVVAAYFTVRMSLGDRNRFCRRS